jgi:methylmalonyl-CoA mutase N-terminal domain/subunit
VEEKRRVLVVENAFTDDGGGEPPALHKLDPELAASQIRSLREFRAERRNQDDDRAARQSLDALTAAARGRGNVVAATLAAVKVGATLGEVADSLRAVFGEHRPQG